MTDSAAPRELPPASKHEYRESERLHRDASSRLPGGVSSNFRLGGHPVPLFFERASGSRLYDVDGNAYLDYALGMGPVILGHAPSAVTQAVAASLGDGQLYAGQHRGELALAERLQRHIPCAEMVRIGLSGSEMDQAALRLARAATGRRLIVKFEGQYHGWFDGILVSVAPPLEGAGHLTKSTQVGDSPRAQCRPNHAGDSGGRLPAWR